MLGNTADIDSETLVCWQVRETVERYFSGVDLKSLDNLAACFTADAVAGYHHGPPDARRIVGSREIAHDIHESCSQVTASKHSLSNCLIVGTEATAAAETFAVAQLLRDGRMLARG